MAGLLDFGSDVVNGNSLSPSEMGLLGLLGGLGQASMPSRLPVPTAAVIGQGLSGFAQGYGQGIQNSLAQQQAEGARLQNANSLINLNIWRAAMGQPALTENDLLAGGQQAGSQQGGTTFGGLYHQIFGGGSNDVPPSGNGAPTAPGGQSASSGQHVPPAAMPGATPTVGASMGASLTPAAAGGGALPGGASGAPGGGNTFMGINLPAGMSPLAYLTLSRLNPQAAGRVIGNQYPGPTDLSRLENERAAIAAGNPQDPRLPTYDLMIAHAVGAPTGYEIGQNGGFQVDPNYVRGQGQIAGAQAWAKAPAEVYTQSMRPVTLRGPGSAYINPALGQTVQVPNEVNYIDPETLAEKKAFIPLGLRVTGNGPLSAAVGNGATPGAVPGTPTGVPSATSPAPNNSGATSLYFNGAPGNAPRAQTSQPAAAVTGGNMPMGEGTPFMTQAPPGQEEIVKQLANNYGDEGKKAYQSAISGLGSMEFIDRDINQLGPTGFQSMGEGADARNQLVKDMNSIAGAAGITAPFDPNKIASWEDFRKETTLLGMKGLASIFGGSREAASIITTSIHAVPNTENSFVGAKLLTNSFKEAFQREVDLRNFETNWVQSHGGNLTGAQESFNQAFPTQAYSWRAISKIQPYAVKTPSDMQRFLPGTYIKMPDGTTRVVPGTPGVAFQGAPSAQ